MEPLPRANPSTAVGLGLVPKQLSAVTCAPILVYMLGCSKNKLKLRKDLLNCLRTPDTMLNHVITTCNHVLSQSQFKKHKSRIWGSVGSLGLDAPHLKMMPTLRCLVFLCIVTESLQIRNLSALNEKRITRVYSGLFKTEKEIYDLTEKIRKASGVVYHGCCRSVSSVHWYDQLPNVLGQNVTLVSFNTRQQYFLREVCLTSSECSCDCTCTLMTQTFTALVYNPLYPQFSSEPVILDIVLAPSYCRCFNNFPPQVLASSPISSL
ncbi:uncharacterized protein LOC131942502 [Physella acuta]|uniref:uncharacterized protein LOC131942502 n=1 Tax=Physella acuta TaxID=109671 RepID=UPI0027DC4F9D|nr:uncharacterized protein LOC131942502 [Physella acuta]